MSFFSDVFDFFSDFYYLCKKIFSDALNPMIFHYGCPNSKRIEKLNLKRRNYN
jgi:hypothetical protein